MLKALCDEILYIDHPQKFLGVHMGTRTTILKLSDGFVIHSPGPLSETEWKEIATLGTAKWIVAPNNFHHLYVEEAQKNFPNAQTAIAPGLKKKRPEVKFQSLLPDADFGPELQTIFIKGNPFMGETVFFHKKSKTLICSDFLHQFDHSDHWYTRLYSKVMGFYGKPSVSRCIRPFYRERNNTKKSLSEILELDIENVIPAHGKVFENDCRAIIRSSYSWLD